MNDRIRQLSNQAYDELVNQTGNIVVVDEDFQQRFAQLIVQECAEKCLDMKYVDPKPHHYSVMLKEHFGVKE